MAWKDVNPYVRFGLGVLLGIITFVGLWAGSDYKESQTPEEVTVRVASVMYGGVVYGVITWYIIGYGVIPIFRKTQPTLHHFVAGLSATLASISLVLIIIDPSNIPLLGDLR